MSDPGSLPPSGDFFEQAVLRELCQVAESAGWKVAFAYDPHDLRQPTGALSAGIAISSRRAILLHPGLWDSVRWAIFILLRELARCLLQQPDDEPDPISPRRDLEANTVRRLVCHALGIRVFDFGPILHEPHPPAVAEATRRIQLGLQRSVIRPLD